MKHETQRPKTALVTRLCMDMRSRAWSSERTTHYFRQIRMDRWGRSVALKLLMACVSPGAVDAGFGGHVLAAARELACWWLVAGRDGESWGRSWACWGRWLSRSMR